MTKSEIDAIQIKLPTFQSGDGFIEAFTIEGIYTIEKRNDAFEAWFAKHNAARIFNIGSSSDRGEAISMCNRHYEECARAIISSIILTQENDNA